jgi:hypothetical protein
MSTLKDIIFDPNSSEIEKRKAKERLAKGTMRYIFTWYNELGAERRGVDFEDFVSLANEAMGKALGLWEPTRGQFNTFTRNILNNALTNFVNKETRRKQVSLDKPIGSSKEGDQLTIADTMGEEGAQRKIDAMMDNETFQKRLADLQSSIKNPVHKYVLRWTTDPRYQELTAAEIADILEQVVGKKPTIQGLNGIRAKFRTEILPKLMRGLE